MINKWDDRAKDKVKMFFLLYLLAFLPLAMTAADKRFTLVIDAGHGGNDAGAIGSITKEKTINLNVALAFGRLVERNCPDVKVVYTRKTDVFIPLHTRADIANRAKADLFISIHTNALPRGRISRGLETYTLGMHRAADNLDVAKRENSVILIEKDYKQRYQGFDPNSSESYIMFEFIQDRNMAQSVELAKYVQKRTCASAGRQNKGVKQAGFLVLRETSMPSCLIELGFISTPDEEKFLHSNDGVSRLANGIYQAFVDYKNKNNKSITVPYKAPTASNEVNIPTVVPQPVVDDSQQRTTRKKSQVAQNLENAREGRVESKAEPTAPNADSIVQVAQQMVQSQPVALAQMPVETPAPVEKPAEKPVPVERPVSVERPAPVETPVAKSVERPAEKPAPMEKPVQKAAPVVAPVQNDAPVFKVQIMAASSMLKTGDAQFKGLKDIDCYQEGGMYKYTVGSSADYQAIHQLRRTLTDRFPQAFIIAFKNGQKTDVQAAIREYKSKKVKK